MFAPFILALRTAGLPASVTEYLTLMGAMQAGVANYNIDDFYYLARTTLVKDERFLDRFDRVFGTVFKGLEPPDGIAVENLPEEWLKSLGEKFLTPEELARVVDENWDPPVTASVRLVSIFDDCMQHLGQAAYVRGISR